MNSSVSMDLSPLFKITAFIVIIFSLFYLGSRYSSGSQQLTLFSFQESSSAVVVLSPNSVNLSDSVQYTEEESQLLRSAPPPSSIEGFHNTGIVDDKGMMTAEFEAEQVKRDSDEEFLNSSAKHGDGRGFRVKIEKFEVCGRGMTDYIPCLDNVEAISMLNSTEKGEKYERHCPDSDKALKCLIPEPNGYRTPIPWPRSRDQVWFSNVPHMRLVEDKGGQNWISRNGDKFVFPGGGTQFIHGAEQYLNHISEMVPEIGFGSHSRVALDVGCGVASFGAYLMKRNVTTMSIAPKDVHENQIQFALERGVPAMVSAFATRRLPYPSQAFDFVHCSRCRINWTRDDGILLLEVDRMIRAGGYFVWAAQPVYKHEQNLQKQWREMDNLTKSICWELVKKDGYIAIWRKPVDNTCYLNRASQEVSPLCDRDDDPDNVWYTNLKACITPLPNNGYGRNVTKWPARLHSPPDRLYSISMDAFISRKEIFRAEMKYWNEIIGSYVGAYHWKKLNLRNVMDMRAGFGGFAVALHDFGIDCWVMNVVPVSGFNTLPVIYDRGLVGVMHDWCEPFDTYPRTYDLLHAMGLFSVERKRCEMWKVLVEMERILRPGGRVYIRDSVVVIHQVEKMVKALGWSSALHESGEGPHASLKILVCDKPHH